MGWNEPDKGKDPWSGKNQPPDLDEALKRLQARIKRAFSSGSGQPPDEDKSSAGGSGSMLALFVGLIILALWALSGIFIVDEGERAAILRFGKYVETVGPGPHWIPRFISSKVLVNVDRVSDYTYSAQMLTNDENLVAVSLVVQYRIGDLKAYLFNTSDPQESLQQAASSALRQVIGKTTLDKIITEGREAWGNDVQDTLVKILEKYKTGIVIVNVAPQPARAPENVQDAFDDAIKAREDGKRFEAQALAYQARVVPIAEGNSKRLFEEAQAYAQQVVLRARGEVAEFLALLPEFQQSPQVTSQRMYLETMQDVLSQTSKIIVDAKSGNLLYLPLDKMMNNVATPSPASPVALPSMDNSAINPENDSSGIINRETNRRTYSENSGENQ